MYFRIRLNNASLNNLIIKLLQTQHSPYPLFSVDGNIILHNTV